MSLNACAQISILHLGLFSIHLYFFQLLNILKGVDQLHVSLILSWSIFCISIEVF